MKHLYKKSCFMDVKSMCLIMLDSANYKSNKKIQADKEKKYQCPIFILVFICIFLEKAVIYPIFSLIRVGL